MLYKLIVLPDGTEHKCPDDHKWLAMDPNGLWFTYLDKPRTNSFAWQVSPVSRHISMLYRISYVITMYGPFEPGHWKDQLYWIGD